MWIQSRHDIISRFPWRSGGVAAADVAPPAACLRFSAWLAGWTAAVAQAQDKSALSWYQQRASRQLNLFLSWRLTEADGGKWLGLLFVLDLLFHLAWFAQSKRSRKVTQRQSVSQRRRQPSTRVNYDNYSMKSNHWESDRSPYFSFSPVKCPLVSTGVHWNVQKIKSAQYQVMKLSCNNNNDVNFDVIIIILTFLCEGFAICENFNVGLQFSHKNVKQWLFCDHFHILMCDWALLFMTWLQLQLIKKKHTIRQRFFFSAFGFLEFSYISIICVHIQ